MKRTSDTDHWDRYWAASADIDDVYATGGRIVENLGRYVDFDGLRVLEVGAGSGRDSVDIASRGASVVTLDYSEEALRIMSATRGVSIEIVCGDARALPFSDGAFDIVFHQGLLEHFRDPGVLLDENVRVLKKGGVLLVDVPQRFHYYTLLKHLLMLLGKWFAGWETEFSPGELRRLVEERGFEVVGFYGENLFPPIWYRGLRRVLLGFGLRLPMFAGEPAMIRGLRNLIKRVVPEAIRMNTSMVIGCVARKT